MEIKELLKMDKYKGCAIRPKENGADVYVIKESNHGLFVLYRVPVVAKIANTPEEILDYAIDKFEEGYPISVTKSFEEAHELLKRYFTFSTRKFRPFDFELLKSGTPLKRKDWKGFWLWDEVRKSIMMHCANNEVIDIRSSKDMDFTITNMYSNDWEVANEENSPIYKNYIENNNKKNYKVIGYEHEAFDKFKCTCGADITMDYDLYNGVTYDKECKCVVRIEEQHVIHAEIRQYMDDCELDK